MDITNTRGLVEMCNTVPFCRTILIVLACLLILLILAALVGVYVYRKRKAVSKPESGQTIAHSDDTHEYFGRRLYGTSYGMQYTVVTLLCYDIMLVCL